MRQLYNNLITLCNNPTTPFYFSDQTIRKEHYRIFSYHFTDKDSWLLPDALEARGIMFEMDTNTMEPLRIASRTPHKFFNYGEVDFIDYGISETVMDKVDGSLISSFRFANGDISVKSKSSINSDHAVLAKELLYADKKLLEWVQAEEMSGRTVNMELVTPDPKFRIVLHYPEPRLIVLNCRDRNTGDYLLHHHIEKGLPKKYYVGTHDPEVLTHLDTATNIEGYVVIDDNFNWWKKKCPWYLERHRAKDFINQPLAFVELVLKDEADDIFQLVIDQPEILKELQELQHKVVDKANIIVNTVTDYWKKNQRLSRKDYAIKGKQELNTIEFPLAMLYYSDNQEPNWKEYFLKMIKKINWMEK